MRVIKFIGGGCSMKRSKNHGVHLVFILIMLLISVIIMQIPTNKNEINIDAVSNQNSQLVNSRMQSLVYTGDIDSIVDGLSRYFVGSMPQALAAFSKMEQCPLSNNQKGAVLLGLVNKLRNHEPDQALTCKYLVEVYNSLSKEPVLYAAVKSSQPEVVKDILRWGADYKYDRIDALVFDAFKYAVFADDLKAIETLYLHGASVTKEEASELLKIVVCENKKINMAKFLIERTHADTNYIDHHNKSLLTYAFAHNNKTFIQVLKNGKKNEQGMIIAFN